MHLSNSYTELVLNHEVAVGSRARKLYVLRHDNDVEDEGGHEELVEKASQGVSRLLTIVCGVQSRPVINQLVNND